MPIEVSHCSNMDFRRFCSRDLDLTRWPSYTNLTHIHWRCTGWAQMNFPHQGFRKLPCDRQTDTTGIIYQAASRVVNEDYASSPSWPRNWRVCCMYALCIERCVFCGTSVERVSSAAESQQDWSSSRRRVSRPHHQQLSTDAASQRPQNSRVVQLNSTLHGPRPLVFDALGSLA